MDLIERVARAIFDARVKSGGPGSTMVAWEVSPHRAWCFATAKDVLEAAGLVSALEEIYQMTKVGHRLPKHGRSIIARISRQALEGGRPNGP